MFWAFSWKFKRLIAAVITSSTQLTAIISSSIKIRDMPYFVATQAWMKGKKSLMISNFSYKKGGGDKSHKPDRYIVKIWTRKIRNNSHVMHVSTKCLWYKMKTIKLRDCYNSLSTIKNYHNFKRNSIACTYWPDNIRYGIMLSQW